MKEEYKCPCQEVDPENFLTNEEVYSLLKTKNSYKFKQDDYYKLYNCIHCNDCGTSEERFLLKQKFLEDGNKIEGLENTIQALIQEGTPFIKNKSRLRLPKGIPQQSDTLLYFGCFTIVKTPRYGENLVKYFLKETIDFSILDKEICCGYPILCNGEFKTYFHLVKKNMQLFKEKGYKRIITVCPSCYMVFKKHYSEEGFEIKYFTEYLKPSKSKKTGNLIIQHACPLRNGEIHDIENDLENLYTNSGYHVLSNVTKSCVGGGVGHQLRIDISEAIAKKRMKDFIKESGTSENPKELNDYITTYCPDAYWVIKVFGRKQKIDYQLKDMCELLM